MKVTPVPLEASICVSEGCYFPLSLMPLQPQWNPALSWVRLPSARVGWGTQTLALKPLGPLLGTPHCTPRPCTEPSRRPQPSSLCRNVLPAPRSHLLLPLRPLRTFQSILAAGRLADPPAWPRCLVLASPTVVPACLAALSPSWGRGSILPLSRPRSRWPQADSAGCQHLTPGTGVCRVPLGLVGSWQSWGFF